MHITKETFNEILFEYFEGNLKETEKAELMNFIHKNPDLNDEFTSWSLTYSRAPKMLENYDIAKDLLRPEPSPLLSLRHINYRWLMVILLFSFTFLLYFFNHIKKIKDVPDKKFTTPTVLKNKTYLKNITTKLQYLPQNDSKKNTSINNSHKLSPKNQMETNEIIHASPLTKSSSDTLIDDNVDSFIIPLPLKSGREMIIRDSFLFNEKLKIQEAPADSTEPELDKIKNRRKLNLAPATEIIPLNTDL